MKNILILIQLTNLVIPQDVPQVEVESNHHFNPYLGHFGKIWERYFWTKKPELILVTEDGLEFLSRSDASSIPRISIFLLEFTDRG